MRTCPEQLSYQIIEGFSELWFTLYFAIVCIVRNLFPTKQSVPRFSTLRKVTQNTRCVVPTNFIAEGKVHTSEHDCELGKGDPGPLSLSFLLGRNPFLISSLFKDFERLDLAS